MGKPQRRHAVELRQTEVADDESRTEFVQCPNEIGFGLRAQRCESEEGAYEALS
jgi:hypothetical protein